MENADIRQRLEELDRTWDARRQSQEGKRGQATSLAAWSLLEVPVAGVIALIWFGVARGVGAPYLVSLIGVLALPVAVYQVFVRIHRAHAYKNDKLEYEQRRGELVARLAEAIPEPRDTVEGVCSFCGAEVGAGRLYRDCGVDICDSCRDPDQLEAAVRAKDWTVSTRRWKERRQRRKTQIGSGYHDKESVTSHCLELNVGAPGTRPIEAQFTAQTLDRQIDKLFHEEAEAGDPVFDDKIYVSTSDREATSAFLKDEGVQTAILDLFAEGAYVTIDATGVHVRDCSYEERSAGDYYAPVFALVWHLSP
jgi:hypothetical protein